MLTDDGSKNEGSTNHANHKKYLAQVGGVPYAFNQFYNNDRPPGKSWHQSDCTIYRIAIHALDKGCDTVNLSLEM